jgi:hypothetical protein
VCSICCLTIRERKQMSRLPKVGPVCVVSFCFVGLVVCLLVLVVVCLL